MCRRLSLLSALLLFACLFALPAHAAPEAGKVVSLTPGVFVERGGKRLPLEMKSPVEAGDTLTSDATGRARILFSDDSSMSIGPNTALALQEFTPGGSKPAVKAHLAKGLLRSITGRIVEQNPEGFSLTSPEATVGIRGTIITMRAGKGVTTVYVENTTRKVFVNGVNVPSGKKITVPGDPVRPEPILPQDRRDLGRDLAFLGGAGTAAAAPEPSYASGTPEATTLLADRGGPIRPEAALAGLSTPADLARTMPKLENATVSGTFSYTYVFLPSSGIAQTFSGGFTLGVDLSTGNVNSVQVAGQGTLIGGGDPFNFVATGGSGHVGPNSMSVTGFTGPVNGPTIPPGAVDIGPYNYGFGETGLSGNAKNGSYVINASNDLLARGTLTSSP